MIRITEATLWKRLRDRWPGHAVRVEASMGGVEPGTPDSNLSLGGKGLWLELKVWGGEPLSSIQLVWHLDAVEKGGGAYLMCAVGRKQVWLGRASDFWNHQENRLIPKEELIELTEAIRRLMRALR